MTEANQNKLKDELKTLAKVAGMNHLTTRINELIDLHGEIINRNMTERHEILKYITDAISGYQLIVKARYL